MVLLLHLNIPLDGSNFKGIKFVCVGGSASRMAEMSKEMKQSLQAAFPSMDLICYENPKTDRYSLFRVGPVLFVNHGIGGPSISIVLHEIYLLLKEADCLDAVFFRIGTCGGIGVDPGTVIITEKVFSSSMEQYLTLNVLGRPVQRPAQLDPTFIDEVFQFAQANESFPIIKGSTLCTDDFFEEQGRVDGAIVDYTEAEKMQFLQDLHDKGIRNIEMESLYLAAFCHKVGMKCVIACLVLLNRLHNDHFVKSEESTMAGRKDRAIKLVCDFIIHKLHHLSSGGD